MKKTSKKLSFDATTVRNLQTSELERAAGAGSGCLRDSQSTCSVTFLGSCMCNVTRICASDGCDSIDICDTQLC